MNEANQNQNIANLLKETVQPTTGRFTENFGLSVEVELQGTGKFGK